MTNQHQTTSYSTTSPCTPTLPRIHICMVALNTIQPRSSSAHTLVIILVGTSLRYLISVSLFASSPSISAPPPFLHPLSSTLRNPKQSNIKMSSSTVCAEQLQKFHSSQQKTHHLHNIDVPPRKLLSRRSRATSFNDDSSSVSTPKTGSAAEEALFRKFLPYNTGFDDDEDDPYSADHFRMFEFKIRRCTRSRSHDWTDCPFAHPGEKARRRDPRRVSYSGTVCPEFRRGACSKGDSCEFAHGVFECWLHPARYRTEACKDGKNCKRKVCFFAHTPKQLRILPPSGSLDDSPGIRKSSRKTHSSSSAGGCNHCCVFCLHHQSSGNSNNNPNSPTSTLLNFSPPHSPMKNRASESFSPISRFGGINSVNGSLSYDEALAELIASLDAIYVADDHHNNILPGNGNYPWMDGTSEIYSPMNNHHHNQQQLQQTRFILSPSSPQQNCFDPTGSCRSNLFDPNPPCSVPEFYSGAAASCTSVDIDAPDVAWVDELLM